MAMVARFDTRDLPPPDRFAWWCDMVDRDMTPTHVSSAHAVDFQASATHIALGEVGISALEMPELRTARTPRLIRRSDPHQWSLALITDGVMGIDQDGTRTRFERGDLLLYDNSRPYDAAVLSATASNVILNLPRELPIPESVLRALLAHPLPAHSGMGALLARYLDILTVQASAMEDGHGKRLGMATLDIATAYLAAQADAVDGLPPATRRVALLRQMKAYIADNLDDHRLSPARVAAAHHISLRYLHYLFQQEDLSVGEFIRRQRLGRCRADLADPLLTTRTVAAIGARWGYTDPATFNRAFKQAFGQPPGEYRRKSQAPGEAVSGKHRPVNPGRRS